MKTRVSIVPPGFEITAHPVFLNYKPVCERNDKFDDISSNYELTDRISQSVDTNLPLREEDDGSEEVDSAICSICMNSYTNPTTLGDCGHSFCFECIMSWYEVKISCPICKTKNFYIIKSCSLSPRHPHGLKILLISKSIKYLPSPITSIIDRNKLKRIISKHKGITSECNRRVGRNIVPKDVLKVNEIESSIKWKQKIRRSIPRSILIKDQLS